MLHLRNPHAPKDDEDIIIELVAKFLKFTIRYLKNNFNPFLERLFQVTI